jgi:tagatose-1,6-bisphosphate aldolase non-catalytic subunit AgaZ/GatZ
LNIEKEDFMLERKYIDNSLIRERAKKLGIPTCDLLMRKMMELSILENTPRTLFAACPNSETVIKAALRSAQRANAPIKFAATLNQVDLDGGYTGMNQFEFVKMVKLEAEAIHYNGPIIIAIDHGGPWLKDIQSQENWPLIKCMEWIKKSFEAAIEAGYDLIHVDPTVDRTLPSGSVIPIDLVITRTVELIEHAEKFRRDHQFPPISYEVGTEEVHGGLADLSVFENFLKDLKNQLQNRGLSDVWPIFVVGKVGTDLHTTTFDPQVAQKLVQIAKNYGSYIKGHYTDYVENPADYPLSGMGGANVGPEFTEEEYNSLLECEKIEIDLDKQGGIAKKSNIMESLEQAVYQSGRWKKWLQTEEKGIDFFSLTPERKAWLTKTGCRYIWSKPEVIKSRFSLYQNLLKNGYQAETIVLSAIEKSMGKYFHAFQLIDLNQKIQKVL